VPDFQIVIVGEGSDHAADEIRDLLADGEAAYKIQRSRGRTDLQAGLKAVDPMALASLVLSVPCAFLSAVDLAERIRKRIKAQSLVAVAKRLTAEKSISVYIERNDGALVPLNGLDPDDVLALAGRAKIVS
jgi:hypothetical protein